MPGRKILNAADAHACIESIATSGQPLIEWCRKHRVDGRSLNAWRHHLGRGLGPAPAHVAAPVLQLVELVAEPAPDRGPTYTIRVGAFAVEVGAGFEPAVLGRLLEVVARC